jgi:hypothetical protein
MAKTMMNQNRYNQMNKKGHKGQNQQPPMGMRGPQMGPMPPGMGMPPRPMMPGGPHGMGGPMGHMMDGGGMPNNMDQDEMGVQSLSGQWDLFLNRIETILTFLLIHLTFPFSTLKYQY